MSARQQKTGWDAWKWKTKELGSFLHLLAGSKNQSELSLRTHRVDRMCWFAQQGPSLCMLSQSNKINNGNLMCLQSVLVWTRKDQRLPFPTIIFWRKRSCDEFWWEVKACHNWVRNDAQCEAACWLGLGCTTTTVSLRNPFSPHPCGFPFAYSLLS